MADRHDEPITRTLTFARGKKIKYIPPKCLTTAVAIYTGIGYLSIFVYFIPNS